MLVVFTWYDESVAVPWSQLVGLSCFLSCSRFDVFAKGDGIMSMRDVKNIVTIDRPKKICEIFLRRVKLQIITSFGCG